MALNKTTLKAALIAAFQYELPNISAEQSTAIDRVCGKIADAIDDYVKSGEVQTGITVEVDPVTGIGSTTSVGTIE